MVLGKQIADLLVLLSNWTNSGILDVAAILKQVVRNQLNYFHKTSNGLFKRNQENSFGFVANKYKINTILFDWVYLPMIISCECIIQQIKTQEGIFLNFISVLFVRWTWGSVLTSGQHHSDILYINTSVPSFHVSCLISHQHYGIGLMTKSFSLYNQNRDLILLWQELFTLQCATTLHYPAQPLLHFHSAHATVLQKSNRLQFNLSRRCIHVVS